MTVFDKLSNFYNMPDDSQKQSIYRNCLKTENNSHMSTNVNKKIVLTTLICYSIHRLGFGSSSFSFWEKDHKFRREGHGDNLMHKDCAGFWFASFYLKSGKARQWEHIVYI
jgi:hypothetical protein